MFALMSLVQQMTSLAQQLAEQSRPPVASASTPSGMVPVSVKPPVVSQRNQRPGRAVGHVGACRPVPQRIDQTKEHRVARCPDCGGALRRCAQTRRHYTEDIPQDITPVVTEYMIHRDWCAHCHKPPARGGDGARCVAGGRGRRWATACW